MPEFKPAGILRVNFGDANKFLERGDTMPLSAVLCKEHCLETTADFLASDLRRFLPLTALVVAVDSWHAHQIFSALKARKLPVQELLRIQEQDRVINRVIEGVGVVVIGADYPQWTQILDSFQVIALACPVSIAQPLLDAALAAGLEYAFELQHQEPFPKAPKAL